MRWAVLIAGLLGACGVAIGAHAAHGLEASLLKQGLTVEEVGKRLSQCDVAVRYHMIHTLAVLVLGLSAGRVFSRRRTAAVVFLLLGMALFSGGLYAMVYLGQMGHWAIVPAGGLCFMIGWFATASLAWNESTEA